MKYLVLTFYYEPDLCAGSFRNTAFIKEFQKIIEPNDSIEVITTMPNRYHTFDVFAKEYEEMDNVKIFRIKLSAHKSGIVDQILSFIYYYRNVFKLTKNKQYNSIFASSSRLFTAFTGARLARKLKVPLYLDIRDIFSETISQVIQNKFISKVTLFIIEKIEKWTIKHANHLNLVSSGFASFYTQFYYGKITYFTNGIDEEFLNIKSNYNNSNKNSNIIITYAGNIGAGQGLEKIIPFVAEGLGQKYLFRIIGDGGTKPVLEKILIEKNIKNVSIEKPVNREELIKIYMDSDFLFLHLNNYPAFERVLPSKIFEYAATNKPIIAGVHGFPRTFLKENIPDAIIFSPCDYKEMIKKIKMYDFPIINRVEFISKFDRKSQMRGMAKSLINVSKNQF